MNYPRDTLNTNTLATANTIKISKFCLQTKSFPKHTVCTLDTNSPTVAPPPRWLINHVVLLIMSSRRYLNGYNLFELIPPRWGWKVIATLCATRCRISGGDIFSSKDKKTTITIFYNWFNAIRRIILCCRMFKFGVFGGWSICVVVA